MDYVRCVCESQAQVLCRERLPSSEYRGTSGCLASSVETRATDKQTTVTYTSKQCHTCSNKWQGCSYVVNAFISVVMHSIVSLCKIPSSDVMISASMVSLYKVCERNHVRFQALI
jgi:hypothetical protein